MRDTRAVMHVGIANPRGGGGGGGTFRHFRRMRNTQIDLSGKRPIANDFLLMTTHISRSEMLLSLTL